MIPLKDNIPHRRLPFVAIFLMVINILIFFYQMGMDRLTLQKFIYQYGFLPRQFWSSLEMRDIFSFLSSMFLHGSIYHLLGNLLFMWIFADNVEDRLGHINFIFLYFFSGIVALITHSLFNFNSKVPAIGASGAIAGLLGAYFKLFPYARVLAIVPALFFWQIVELPAFIFLGLWFVYQFVLGLLNLGIAAGIAFWAHIGGFLAGIFFLKLTKR